MNIIISYLDTMFSAYPETPRLLEAKAELQGMMEDAYTSLLAEGRSENEAVGQVIRDFGNLAEVAPELGITTELNPIAAPALAAPTPAASAPAAAPEPPRHPSVTMSEAREYADARQRIRYRVALAVALFVVSPVALVVLPTAARAGVAGVTDGVASLIGIVTLFAFVAAGVLTLVSTTHELAAFARITEGRFTPDPVVSAWATELRQQHERTRTRALQVSVLLWILSPVPLLAFSFLDGLPNENLWIVSGVAGMLAFVATGLFVLLPNAWAYSVAERLTGAEAAQEAANAEEHGIVGVIASFYWPLLTAIYLGWSFIGNAWDQSWIIWPVGAVLFGAIAAGAGALDTYRKNQRR
ncbi:hypothetical protein EDF60_1992 [Leucobacter luti]|uniref:permease prefix domain 1-containing protein n=1 Tax=Leucobacter luti TaxID=340320 RepID=UPI00104354CF|nr:permease prefix domain 1-containing protein [Leucobacter luti]MCW2287338.1 hypothetical protein [Leucobacter luti]TCK41561.1 hypothetical protein EDF60_1992 [Leucobacter luti]